MFLFEIAHPFDADGMVSAITFKEGKAFFRNRFVKTKGFTQEMKRNKILYRGIFGTKKSGGLLANIFDIRLKNVANTNVLYWDDKLVALWEAGLPHRLDPISLRTYKQSNLGGILQKGESFSAHPRICSYSGRLVNFAVNVSPVSSKTKVNFWEINPDYTLHEKKSVEEFDY